MPSNNAPPPETGLKRVPHSIPTGCGVLGASTVDRTQQPSACCVAPAPRHRHALPHATRRGYTLVEVLIVVVIVGIAGVIVVPGMMRSGTMGIQAATRSVIADLLYAQNQAIAHQRPFGVQFNTGTDAYRVIDEDGQTIESSWRMGGGGEGYAISFRNDRRFQGVELIQATFTGEPGKTVWFDPMGAPSEGGTVVLQFEQTRYRVQVAPFTGRVAVELIQ